MWIEDDIENNDEDEPWKAKMAPPPLIWRLPTLLSLCRWWSTWINIINTIINTIIIINIINILKPMNELEDEHIKIEFWIAKAPRCNVLGNYPGRRGGKKLRWMITQFAGGTGPRGKKWDSGLRSVFFALSHTHVTCSLWDWLVWWGWWF